MVAKSFPPTMTLVNSYKPLEQAIKDGEKKSKFQPQNFLSHVLWHVKGYQTVSALFLISC